MKYLFCCAVNPHFNIFLSNCFRILRPKWKKPATRPRLKTQAKVKVSLSK